MQEQQIHKVLSSLAKGSPVELVKGIVIGYDVQGTLRLYNADMTQEEIIVACEKTKAKAMGMVSVDEVPAMIARQMASNIQRAGSQSQASTEISGTKVE